jgi:hypothetical protein
MLFPPLNIMMAAPRRVISLARYGSRWRTQQDTIAQLPPRHCCNQGGRASYWPTDAVRVGDKCVGWCYRCRPGRRQADTGLGVGLSIEEMTLSDVRG